MRDDIEAGKKADLVVLDRNPLEFSARTEGLSKIAVRMTFAGGALVYEDRRAASDDAGPTASPATGGRAFQHARSLGQAVDHPRRLESPRSCSWRTP